jgi:SNF2 family DNA or RNA helicase
LPDLQRCLVICPGSLAEQWQDELSRRFDLPFEILTNDALDAARTGNRFLETNLVIARLDKLSHNEDVNILVHPGIDRATDDKAKRARRDDAFLGWNVAIGEITA